MLTSYSRVTVISGSRRVDLALPSALPVADVVPQVLRFCAPEENAGNPSEFTLARIGGQSLTLSQSLAEAGVRDGDVIELRAFSAEGRAAFIEDVRDAIEDSVDGARGAWTSRSTVTFAIVTTCGVLLLFLVGQLFSIWSNIVNDEAMYVSGSVEAQDVVSAWVAASLLLGATWVATRWAAPWTPYVSVTVASLLAFAAGTELASQETPDVATGLTVGIAAAAVVAGVARLLTPRATPLLAATVIPLLATGTIVIAQELGAEPGFTVRVVAALAVLSIGVMPRLSIAVGGLSSADYRVRNAGKMSERLLNARFQESSGLLLGSVIGVSLLVGLTGNWLGLQPTSNTQGDWDRVLSLSLAATVLLRSRVFSRIQYMVPPRVAGLFILIAGVQQLMSHFPVFEDWVIAALATAGLVVTGISILKLSDVTRARTKRILNVVEFIVVVDLVVVTMGAIGLYDYVRN